MEGKITFTAVYEEAPEGGYIAFVEEIPGANSQGETLDEARSNLLEALQLLMETQRILSKEQVSNKKVIRENLQLV